MYVSSQARNLASLAAAKLAETAFASADTLNDSFLGFYPETCLSGHDNMADIADG